MNDIPKFSPEMQFHLLRHFNVVPGDYLQYLSRLTGHTHKLLELQLLLPGSKFNSDFAESPIQLHRRICGINLEEWRIVAKSAEKTDYLITFSDDVWPYGIGFDNVMETKTLTTEELSDIRFQTRRDVMVKTLIKDSFPITHQLVLIVGKSFTPISIFPGKWLPPLNEKLINDYVFLIKP